jgi:hypothetical protein
VRALRAELAERGARASYGAVWSFLAAEGLTFKTYGPPRLQAA